MADNSTLSFVVAAKKFFGMRQGQTLADFSAELKLLTPDDRKELAAGLAAVLGQPVAA